MCILLVEDETVLRETLADALANEGFEVCQAETSDQAADLIETPPTVFLLLITNIDLPGKRDGPGIAQLIHHTYPSLPVLYITGRPDRMSAIGPREAALSKPFTLQHMIGVVQHLLGTKC